MITNIKRCFSVTKKIISQSNTNMYLLNCGTKCLIIDPGDDFDSIMKLLSKECPKSKPDIFLTHGHRNHIISVPQLCDRYKEARVFASKKDSKLFVDTFFTFSKQKRSTEFTIDNFFNKMKFVNDNDTIKINNDVFEVMDLAGHTPGSIGLYCKKEKCAFVGDTLMFESLGSVDSPLADDELLAKNIRMKLLTLDENTVIYPGHGKETTIGHEKEKNEFLKHPFFGDATNMSLFEPLVTDFLIHCV